jgi:hypothetical protein
MKLLLKKKGVEKMYSRIRLLTDLTKLRDDIRDMLKHTSGIALKTTNSTLTRIVLDVDELLAIEHTKRKTEDDYRQPSTLNN